MDSKGRRELFTLSRPNRDASPVRSMLSKGSRKRASKERGVNSKVKAVVDQGTKVQ